MEDLAEKLTVVWRVKSRISKEAATQNIKQNEQTLDIRILILRYYINLVMNVR
jgi:hypothetical protein